MQIERRRRREWFKFGRDETSWKAIFRIKGRDIRDTRFPRIRTRFHWRGIREGERFERLETLSNSFPPFFPRDLRFRSTRDYRGIRIERRMQPKSIHTRCSIRIIFNHFPRLIARAWAFRSSFRKLLNVLFHFPFVWPTKRSSCHTFSTNISRSISRNEQISRKLP